MKDRTELLEICKVYSSASKLIMDINDIITESKDIDDKYKDLVHCFDNVDLMEIHFIISTSILGCMTLSNHSIIDFENISDMYLYSGALLKYDLHEDEYVDKYVESQTNTILLLDDNAKTLNTIKDYDCINDDEYHKLVNCIWNLLDNAANTGIILKNIIEHSKKEEER